MCRTQYYFLSRRLTGENTSSLLKFKALISGEPILVCRNAPEFRDNHLEINFSEITITEAYGAATVFMDIGVVPEVICTYLHGNSKIDFETKLKTKSLRARKAPYP